MDIAARMAEKRVQIEELKKEDASDETTLVGSAATKNVTDTKSQLIDTGLGNGQMPKKRWRRVSRIFSFLNRSSRGTGH